MKKIFFITIIVLGILVFIGTSITTPTLKGLSVCYDNASAQLEQGIVQAQKESWDKYQLCLNGKEILESFKECYSLVENKTNLPPSIAGFITYFAKLIRPNIMDINDLKNQHNEACKDFPAAIAK